MPLLFYWFCVQYYTWDSKSMTMEVFCKFRWFFCGFLYAHLGNINVHPVIKSAHELLILWLYWYSQHSWFTTVLLFVVVMTVVLVVGRLTVGLSAELQCKECGRVFKHSMTLKRHERYHEKVRHQTCSECGVIFRSDSYLLAHLLKSHRISPTTRWVVNRARCFSVASSTLDQNGTAHVGSCVGSRLSRPEI